MERKIVKTKPYFDKNGNFVIPSDTPFGGEMNPKLNLREWFLWLLDQSENVPEHVYSLVGSPVTIWRTRKRLQDKGYGK